MDDVRKGRVGYTALVALLIAAAMSVAVSITAVRVALAEEDAPAAVQVVDTGDQMGPWPYGQPLIAQSQTVDQIVFGTNNSTRLSTTLPILKGAGFDFVQVICPVNYEKLSDGTEVYSIGFDSMKTALYADLIKGKATIYQTAVKNFKKAGKRGGGGGSFSPYYEVYALCKAKGDTRSGEGVIMLGVFGTREGQYYIFTGGVSLTGTIGTRFNFTYASSDFKGGLSIVGKLGLKVFGGIGAAYLGRLGFYGNSTLSVMGTVQPKEDAGWDYAKLRGALGVEVVAFGYSIWSKDLWKAGPYDLFTPRKSEIVGMSEGVAGDESLGPQLTAADDGGLQFVPIAYDAKSEGAWNGDDYVTVPDPASGGGSGSGTGEDVRTSDLSMPQSTMRLLESSVYPDAQVELVSTPKGAVMCWIASDGTDASGRAKTRLMWSRSDDPLGEGTWSTPAQVDVSSDRRDTADFEPDLYADEAGNVHVVWLDEAKPLGSGTTPQDLMEGLCVSYAYLEAGKNAFGPVETAADRSATAGVVRTSPKVAARAGEVICGYSTLQTSHLIDLAGTHEVFVAKRGGGGAWSESRVHEGLSTVTSLDAGLLGASPSVAWTLQDLSMSSAGDVSGGVSQVHVLTASNQSRTFEGYHAQFDDHCSLTWKTADDGEGTCDLMHLDSPTASAYVLASDVDLPSSYQVAGDVDGSGAMISYQAWESTADGEDCSSDLYGRAIAGGKLSDEAILVAHEDDLTSHDIAFANGEPMVAFAAETGIGGGAQQRSSDLLVASGNALERLSVESVTYDDAEVTPGAQLIVEVCVRNAGTATIEEGVHARITNTKTGDLMGAGAYAAAIGPSETVTIRVPITVPEDTDVLTGLETSVAVYFGGDAGSEEGPAMISPLTVMGGRVDDPTPTPTPTPTPAPTPTPVSYGGRSASSGPTYQAKTQESQGTLIWRLAGANRYETSAAVVSAGFEKSDWVVVATGADFPDALAAAAVAGAYGAPVVLTTPGSLSSEAAGEISRLGASHAIIMGGTAAVSEAVEGELKQLVGDVTRIAGADREATSVAAFLAARARVASDTILVATSAGFADALSAGAWSWKTSSSVLLARGGVLTAEEVEAVRAASGIRRVVLLGGTAVVSDEIRTQLGDGYEYVRLGGSDRYETSSLVATWACGQGLDWGKPSVATGSGFADALSGAALAGKFGSPVLLCDSSDTRAASTLSEHGGAVSSLYVLGGEAAVSKTVEQRLADAIA